jgi:hypothetical protein
MKQGGGSFGGSSAKKPPQSVGQPSFVRGKSVGSAASSTKTDSLSFSKASLRNYLPVNSSSAEVKSADGISSPTTSSIATSSTTRTASSSKKEDPSIAKGKMLGDIGKVNMGSLRKTKTPANVGVKVIDGSSGAAGSNNDSSPLGTKKVWDKDSQSWLSTTPLKSNVTPAVKSNFIKLRDEEEKKENESSPPLVTKQVSELTSSDGIDLDESPTPPLLTRVSSPSTDFVSVDTASNPSDMFETPSGWGRRLTAADIQAQIEAVENEDEEDGEESIEHEPQDLNLGPNSFYSPGYDQAIRNSNASWDRRPSSRDIMARIKEAEELEAKHAEVKDDLKRAEMIRTRMANKFGLAMIGENQNEPTTSVEVRRKARNGDDDASEVSELSMTTYEENALDLSKGRSIPHSLFLRQDLGNAKVPFSPALTSSPSPGFLHSKGACNEKAQEAIRLAEKGELNLPPLPVIHDESSSTVKSDAMSGKTSKAESREETEEEKLRRERAGTDI